MQQANRRYPVWILHDDQRDVFGEKSPYLHLKRAPISIGVKLFGLHENYATLGIEWDEHKRRAPLLSIYVRTNRLSQRLAHWFDFKRFLLFNNAASSLG